MTSPTAVPTRKDGPPDLRSSVGRGIEDDPWDLDDLLDPDALSSLPFGEMPVVDGIADFTGGSDRFFNKRNYAKYIHRYS